MEKLKKINQKQFIKWQIGKEEDFRSAFNIFI